MSLSMTMPSTMTSTMTTTMISMADPGHPYFVELLLVPAKKLTIPMSTTATYRNRNHHLPLRAAAC